MTPDNTETRKWPEKPWFEVVDRVKRIVFRIECPGGGYGTAFAVSLGKGHDGLFHYFLATAKHVVDDEVGKDVQLTLYDSEGRVVSGVGLLGRNVVPFGESDAALIYFYSQREILTVEHMLPVLDWDRQMAQGSELGWLGFPYLADTNLCFFSGNVAGYLNDPPTYLIDGVAINGVSGGPAFDNTATLVGLVSSYIPNVRDNQLTLPGLLAVTPISVIRLYLEKQIGAKII